MPSWLPGDDYYTNFHEGDPFLKVPEGYARLPGAGYEALHPELKDVSPEDYPDIHKMAILTKTFSDGEVRLVVPKGAADSAEAIRAVILAGGENVNQGGTSFSLIRHLRDLLPQLNPTLH